MQRPRGRVLRVGGILRQQHRADRQRGRHRADARVDDAVAHRRHDAPRDRLGAFGAAILQQDPEFVRGEAADAIPAAQGAADAAADNGDDLVADIVAIGFVDEREIVDAGEQKRALGGRTARVPEEAGQLLGQPGAIELTGELVVIAEIEQPLFLVAAAIVDDF